MGNSIDAKTFLLRSFPAAAFAKTTTTTKKKTRRRG
jgi:hypothetical protein